MSTGVILARLQPIHNGHLELIRQALNENEKVLVLVGSADKVDRRNPIPIKLRVEMAKNAIAEKFAHDAERVTVQQLNDYTDETDNSYDWGFYLYAHIVKFIESPYFTLYYSDDFQIIMKWFPSFIFSEFVSFKLNARGAIFNALSATKVRQMIKDNNLEELRECVPTSVLENVTLIRHFINNFE